MGSDFSFIVLAKEDSKKAIEEYINRHSDEKIALGSMSSLSINFPLDSFVLKYLEGGYNYPAYDTFDEAEYFLRDEYKASIGCIDFSEEIIDDSDISDVWKYKASIGCIDFSEEIIDDSDICKYRFTAVARSMSLLFAESLSIRKWFVELGKISNALIVYMDMDIEYNGNRIIYFNGKEINILLKGDSHYDLKGDSHYNLTVDEFCDSIEMFAKAHSGHFL